MAYTVYCHTNKINGKKYVGITAQSVYDRWQNGKHYSRHKQFYSDIITFGWDNFNHEILYTNLSKEDAEAKERELIKRLDLTNSNKGYNIRSGGKAVSSHTDKTKAKLSELSKGKNNPFYNCNHTEQSKRLMSEIKPKKMVVCIETQEVFKSTRDAERQTQIDHSDIIKVCKGKKLTAGGFRWRYGEEANVI